MRADDKSPPVRTGETVVESSQDALQRAAVQGSSLGCRVITLPVPDLGPHALPLLLLCDAELKVEFFAASIDDKTVG